LSAGPTSWISELQIVDASDIDIEAIAMARGALVQRLTSKYEPLSVRKKQKSE
jgi:hypothetical protein